MFNAIVGFKIYSSLYPIPLARNHSNISESGFTSSSFLPSVP